MLSKGLRLDELNSNTYYNFMIGIYNNICKFQFKKIDYFDIIKRGDQRIKR